MSPLMIKMLLHYYACARDYRDEVDHAHAHSEAVKEAIDAFLEWDLLIPTVSHDYWKAQDKETRLAQFTVSDRGRAMVEAYKAVKLPICQWVQP
jgi:hypothetical protein